MVDFRHPYYFGFIYRKALVIVTENIPESNASAGVVYKAAHLRI